MGLFKVIGIFITCIIGTQATQGDTVNVTTPNGPLFGIERVTENLQIPYWTFLGIPFAAPPIGENRFRAPRPVANWTQNYNATYERSNCIFTETATLPKDILTGNYNISGNEDCLYLNIFTTKKPDPTLKTELLPVIVWIHGGAFIFGTGNTQLNKTEGFLEHGVLYVGINYRLDVFGFLSTEDEASPGNYGLKDQIAALKYIKNNIAMFGGDPDKITIFGESAGAVSVHYLIQSSLTKGLYRAAITDSGSSLCPWAAARNPRKLAFAVGRKNNITAFTSIKLIKELRQVDNITLQKSVSGIWMDFGIWNGLPWAPCIEKKSPDAVVTDNSFVQLSNGDFQQVPLLTGFNSNEARDLKPLMAFEIGAFARLFTLDPSYLVPADMNSIQPFTFMSGLKIKTFYFNDSITAPNFEKYATDDFFIRPIHKTVQLYSKSGAPVYFYEFAYEGGAARNGTAPGVGHAEELQFLFNYPQVSESAKTMQELMLTLWTNFVKFMNPTPDSSIAANSKKNNVTLVKWEKSTVYGNNNTAYYLIDTNPVMLDNPKNEAMQFWDSQYDEYGRTPFNNY